MVHAREHDVARTAQRGTVEADAGRRAGLADPHTVGLSVLVVVVRTQREPAHAGRDLVAVRALGRIELGEKGRARRELVLLQVAREVPDAVGRVAAQHHMAHLRGAAAVLHVVADRVAAARIADEDDLGRTRLAQDGIDPPGQEGHRLGGRAAAGLGDGVFVARQGHGLVEGEQPLARPAVGFEAPHGGLPQRGGVAVAVHEDDGRVRRGRHGRAGGEGEQRGRAEQQGAALGHVSESPGFDL